MHYRTATIADAQLLAGMNAELIRDEGHRNPMTLPQLAQRMAGFLTGGYEAVVFEHAGGPAGYALYRREPERIYVRQFLVKRDHRRRGIGREAVGWLKANAWAGCPRIRLDVLVGNAGGIAFWRSLGFADYCLTMELEIVPPSG